MTRSDPVSAPAGAARALRIKRGMASHLTRLFLGIPILLLLGAAPPPTSRAEHRLEIFKADRRMELWVAGERVRTFRVGLGGQPAGDKVRQGDSRTPEGTFYVAWKNPKSNFHLFLGLSYPMPRHAKQGLDAKLIDRATAKKITKRTRRKAIPPQTTPLGGYIGVHGGGSGSDWTLGCIAVSNTEIEWLYARLRRGDEIRVHP